MSDQYVLNQTKPLTLIHLGPFFVRKHMFLSVNCDASVDKFVVYHVVHLFDVPDGSPLSAVAGKPLAALGDQVVVIASQKPLPPIIGKCAVHKLFGSQMPDLLKLSNRILKICPLNQVVCRTNRLCYVQRLANLPHLDANFNDHALCFCHRRHCAPVLWVQTLPLTHTRSDS